MDPDRRELYPLTGLRGLAALAVLAYHCWGSPNSNGLRLEISHGYLAVDLFFMLSGFVLAYVYRFTFRHDRSWTRIRKFLWARFSRIYPVHLATLLLLLPLYGSQGFSGGSLINNLFFSQIFFETSLTWNASAWSISAEWYAYLLFPFIAIPLIERLLPLSSVAIVGFCLVPEATLVLSLGHGDIARTPIVLVRALPEFMTGMLIYRCFASNWLIRVWKSDSAFLLCFALIIAIAAFNRTDLPIVALLAVLLLCCAHNRKHVAAVLGGVPILFFGRISYSLYMVQAPAFFAATELRSRGIVTNATVFGWTMAALSFAMAVPMSRFIEYPARDFLRNLLNPFARSDDSPLAVGSSWRNRYRRR